MKTKVILLKQISFILMCVIGSIFINGCDVTTKQEVKSVISNIAESPEVKAVRNSTMDNGVILGDLIDSGISNTIWEIYDPAEDGNKYVTITGNVLYHDTPVVVKIQYRMYDDGKIEFTAMTYNDVPQNTLNTAAMFNYLKEQYEAKLKPVTKAEATPNIKAESETAKAKAQAEIAKAEAETAKIKSETVKATYEKYANGRYGFSLDYPVFLTPGVEPDNGDGLKFTSNDGNSELVCYGGYNINEDTVSSLYNEYINKHTDITYKTKGKNWFVLSWNEGGKIFYQKVFVGKSMMKTFYISYPMEKDEYFTPIVGHISSSFKPGDL
jgi:hypothetical protein